MRRERTILFERTKKGRVMKINGVEVPKRMLHLPINERGMVPWFVAKVDGAYDHRVAAQEKVGLAHNNKLCWLCGQPRGVYGCFVVGPMCTVNRISSEPPSHKECAEFAVKVCPFLSRPQMKRSPRDLPDDKIDPAGVAILRNPGVTALWVTKSYTPFRAHRGNAGILFHIGDPVSVDWYREGRAATRDEVEESMRTGMPALYDLAKKEGQAAVDDLNIKFFASLAFLPKKVTQVAESTTASE